MSVEFWRRAAYPLFLVAAVLLLAVLVPDVGSRINGAQRWFRIGPVNVQASEFAKFALLVYVARALERKGADARRFWRGWLPVLLHSAALSGLVLLEPDFGAALFLMTMTLLLVFLAGVPFWQLAAVGATAIPVVGLLVLTQPYRANRIVQYLNGWSDSGGVSYHVQQSLVAVGSGGPWGVGLGRAWQKLGFLPEANTDFVFAILGEELGLAGTLTVLALWGTWLICGVRLAWTMTHDLFRFLVSFGLVSQLVLQALINVGVVTASLPAKGMCLPFISYGGSNLVMSLVSVGVILGLTRKGEQGARLEDREGRMED
jgi:cell division protein FtsW